MKKNKRIIVTVLLIVLLSAVVAEARARNAMILSAEHVSAG